MRTVAIIVAAGRGERLGAGRPKQFLVCAGRPLLAHTLDRFCRAGDIERLVVAVPRPDDLAAELGPLSAWPLPIDAVQGGARRQDSVAAGLAAAGDAPLVVVHDGVRPLVPVDVIRRVCREAGAVGAAVAAAPCTDTVKEVEAGRIRRTLPREQLVMVQTPQAFRRELLIEAHRRAAEDGVDATDDAVLVERLGATVAVVTHAEPNLKVTHAADLVLAEHYLAATARERP